MSFLLFAILWGEQQLLYPCRQHQEQEIVAYLIFTSVFSSGNGIDLFPDLIGHDCVTTCALIGLTGLLRLNQPHLNPFEEIPQP